MHSPNKLRTLHMCDFCSREADSCGANPVRAGSIRRDRDDLSNPKSVVACSGYENPVDLLREKFH